MRAGGELAEDVKRRMITACSEAGLKIESTRMNLRRDRKERVIQVSAVTREGPFQRSMVDIVAIMKTGGDWGDSVAICCAAVMDDVNSNFWDIPVMRGREAVPLGNLAEHLRKTVEEREQVAAAYNMGIAGPYRFEESCWDKPSEVMKIP
jgi:hypothetical protein